MSLSSVLICMYIIFFRRHFPMVSRHSRPEVSSPPLTPHPQRSLRPPGAPLPPLIPHLVRDPFHEESRTRRNFDEQVYDRVHAQNAPEIGFLPHTFHLIKIVTIERTILEKFMIDCTNKILKKYYESSPYYLYI